MYECRNMMSFFRSLLEEIWLVPCYAVREAIVRWAVNSNNSDLDEGYYATQHLLLSHRNLQTTENVSVMLSGRCYLITVQRWVSKQIEQPVLQIVAIQCIQWSSECSLSAVLLMCGQVCVSLGPGSMSVWLQPAPANQFLPTTLPVITSDSLIMKYFYHQTSQYSAHPYQPSKCQPGVCCYQLSVESETVQISSIRAAFKAEKVQDERVVKVSHYSCCLTVTSPPAQLMMKLICKTKMSRPCVLMIWFQVPSIIKRETYTCGY